MLKTTDNIALSKKIAHINVVLTSIIDNMEQEKKNAVRELQQVNVRL